MTEMAMKVTSSVKEQKNARGFTAVLSCAACEWVLLFLLLVNGVLSYLLTKFASYCNLQAPCILCSRLDHVLGKAKPGYYRNLICKNHQSEISSLMLCHIHSKLADGHGMCDDCLFSFTLKNSTNPEAQKFLMSKLGVAVGGGLCSSLINKDLTAGSLISRLCTCCKTLVKSRQDSQRLFTLKSSGTHLPKPNLPLPHVPRRSRLSRKNSWNKIGDNFYESITSCPLGKDVCDSISHAGYSEMKFGSDSESDFPFSEDEDVGNLIIEKFGPKEGLGNHYISIIPPRRTTCGTLRSIHGVTESLASPSDTSRQPDVSKVQDLKSVPPNADSHSGLNEIDCHHVNKKCASAVVPELILLDEISTPSNGGENSHNESSESKMKPPLPESSTHATLSKFMPLNGKSTADEVSTEKYATQPKNESINIHEDSKKSNATGVTLVESDHIVNHSSHINKIADTNKEREAFAFAAGRPMMEEPTRVSEELKMLSSHNDSFIGANASSTIPPKDGYDDEIHIVDAFGSTEPQVLQKSISVESGLESLDGSNISEFEGETLVDKLKNQVLCYKKLINVLHKELEEERNASAVAANEAMAMITRLQEEKAALHMDALQYLRMMEEQAEYDGEELDKANDLLAEKDKEIQDLEAELELLRSISCDESVDDSIHQKSCDSKRESITSHRDNSPCTAYSINVSSDSKMRDAPKSSHETIRKTSGLKLEDEKLYILQRLESLENKILKIVNKENSSYVLKSEPSEKYLDDIENQKQDCCNGGVTREGQMIEKYPYMQHDSHLYNERSAEQDGSTTSSSEDCSSRKENSSQVLAEQRSSDHPREVNLVVLAHEIADLNDRLEALEADHDFLEHSFNCLQKGKEGLQFIQEIAHQMQELRKSGIRP